MIFQVLTLSLWRPNQSLIFLIGKLIGIPDETYHFIVDFTMLQLMVAMKNTKFERYEVAQFQSSRTNFPSTFLRLKSMSKLELMKLAISTIFRIIGYDFLPRLSSDYRNRIYFAHLGTKTYKFNFKKKFIKIAKIGGAPIHILKSRYENLYCQSKRMEPNLVRRRRTERAWQIS